jgi:non-specific serine/threonine protein kinase
MPLPRAEVAATVLRGEIVVVGGFLAHGGFSDRVDAYSPARNRWRRLPDLPVSMHHGMAAAAGGRLYVAGGYGESGILSSAFVLDGARWIRLPDLPGSRAAGGAAAIGNHLYVAGGVTDEVRIGDRRLAQEMLVLDLRTRRWSRRVGPTPREHLGVTASRGRLYVIAGRLAGLDTNLALVEAFEPASGSWRRMASVPGRRGGTAAAALKGTIVSAGGEEPTGTIRTVFALDTRTNRWRRLPNLRVARHGLGVVAAGGRVFAVAGGRVPGLSVSGVNESLALGG